MSVQIDRPGYPPVPLGRGAMRVEALVGDYSNETQFGRPVLAVACGAGKTRTKTGAGRLQYVYTEQDPNLFGIPIEPGEKYFLYFNTLKPGFIEFQAGTDTILGTADDVAIERDKTAKATIFFGFAWYPRETVRREKSFSDDFGGGMTRFFDSSHLHIPVMDVLITEHSQEPPSPATDNRWWGLDPNRVGDPTLVAEPFTGSFAGFRVKYEKTPSGWRNLVPSVSLIPWLGTPDATPNPGGGDQPDLLDLDGAWVAPVASFQAPDDAAFAVPIIMWIPRVAAGVPAGTFNDISPRYVSGVMVAKESNTGIEALYQLDNYIVLGDPSQALDDQHSLGTITV